MRIRITHLIPCLMLALALVGCRSTPTGPGYHIYAAGPDDDSTMVAQILADTTLRAAPMMPTAAINRVSFDEMSKMAELPADSFFFGTQRSEMVPDTIVTTNVDTIVVETVIKDTVSADTTLVIENSTLPLDSLEVVTDSVVTVDSIYFDQDSIALDTNVAPQDSSLFDAMATAVVPIDTNAISGQDSSSFTVPTSSYTNSTDLNGDAPLNINWGRVDSVVYTDPQGTEGEPSETSSGTTSNVVAPSSNSVSEEHRLKLSFPTGKVAANAESTKVDSVLQLYKQNQDLKIYLSSFTDASGGERQNMTLSRLRAERFRDQLVKAGIPDQQIFLQYFGEKFASDTSDGNSGERRVVIGLKE